MTMKMKMLNEADKKAARLRAAARVFRREVASALEVKLSLFLEEKEDCPDLRQLAVLIERLVDWQLDRVETALEEIALEEPEVASAVERREGTRAGFEADCGAGLRALAELGLLAGEEKVAFMVPSKSRRCR